MGKFNNLSELLSAFGKVKGIGRGEYQVSCPVPTHGKGKGDKNPSLHITLNDAGNGAAMHCKAGCSNEGIVRPQSI